LSLAHLGACGGSAAPARKLTVLVEDDGIDPSLPVFRDVVVATYTLACTPTDHQDGGFPDPLDRGTPPPDGGFAFAPADAGDDAAVTVDESAKAALLRELASSDESCELRAGIATSPPPLADLESQRADWNAKVRGDRDVIDDPLLKTIDARVGERFHGTSTAGIVAFQNPSARLVVVNRSLATAEEVAAMVRCPQQRDLDAAALLLADPDVVQAYAARPLGSDERAFAKTIADHDVAIVNESFGPLSRHGLEKLLFRAGCPLVELDAYFAALNELQHRDYLRAPTQKILTIRAAGNESARLDRRADGLDCRDDQPTLSLVGSYGVIGEKSAFTNFGDCVDVFAPGEAVVGPLPGDWWYPQFGTSFAAPLVTRLVSMLPVGAGGFDPLAARQALHALRRPDGSIPRPRFPEELLYLPGRKTPLALTIDASPRVTQSELVRALWPLRALQRLRGVVP
jgi:hypothetical protein